MLSDIATLDSIVIAGMPSFSLTDLAKMRFEVLSFFVATFLASALVLKLTWNYLAPDFSWMPQVSYKKSLALLGVAGLFMYVVLTMISGARELMTPGAWIKNGATYKLRTQTETDVKIQHRRLMIENLSQRLREYANTTDGKLPTKRLGPEIPVETWIYSLDGKQSMPFEYIGGLDYSLESTAKLIVAYEPPLAGSDRFVLFTNGEIQKLDWSVVRELVYEQKGLNE